MKAILATKEQMTQMFDEQGTAYPVTVLHVGPVVVTQVKTFERDGYAAVQVGTTLAKEKHVNKAQRGHQKGLPALYRTTREFSAQGGPASGWQVGDMIDITQFEAGDRVSVSAISKGKGFQGVVKRHGFHGGPRSHGQKHSEREPGSIGSAGVQRVFKGVRMAGRMGGERVSVKNLTVLRVDPEKGELFIRGAVPGRRGTLVEVVQK